MEKDHIKLLVLLGLLVLVLLSAWHDYAWRDWTVQRYAHSDYYPVAELADASTFFAPWSMLTTPVTAVWFVNPAKCGQFGRYLLVPVVHLQYHYWFFTEKEIYLNIIDADNQTEAYMAKFDPNRIYDIKWYDVNRNPASRRMFDSTLRLLREKQVGH